MKKIKVCLTVLLMLSALSAAGCSSSKEILLGTSAAEETSEEDSGSAGSSDSESSADAAETEDPQEDSGSSQQDAVSGEDLIYVYICGAVKEPGVYIMQAGDRICDLVEAAGGLTADADEAAVNQAEVLSDEQMVYIYSLDEDAQIASDSGLSSGSSSSDESGKVNINTADAAELATLSGIGEAKAESIIAYREENGDFSSIEEIMNVNGIKEGIYAQIKDDICV